MSSTKIRGIMGVGVALGILNALAECAELKDLGVTIDTEAVEVTADMAEKSGAAGLSEQRSSASKAKCVLIIGACGLSEKIHDIYTLQKFVEPIAWEPIPIPQMHSRQEKKEMRRQAVKPPKMQAMAAKCRRR